MFPCAQRCVCACVHVQVDRQYLEKDKESRHNEEVLKLAIKQLRENTDMPKKERRCTVCVCQLASICSVRAERCP